MTEERWWIGKDLEGSGRCLIEVLSRYLSGWIEDNCEEPVRIADVLTEIRTEHLPNTSPERYPYTSLFGFMSWLSIRQRDNVTSMFEFILGLNVPAEWVAFLFRILKVPGVNVGPETGYLDLRMEGVRAPRLEFRYRSKDDDIQDEKKRRCRHENHLGIHTKVR
jgi:hypothetical protein